MPDVSQPLRNGSRDLEECDEGLANGRLIGVFSVLLAGGAVLPLPSSIYALSAGAPLTVTALLGTAAAM